MEDTKIIDFYPKAIKLTKDVFLKSIFNRILLQRELRRYGIE